MSRTKKAERRLKPKARLAGLVTSELPDEVLVYDLESHKAHCLNRAASLVWKMCDGRRTVEEMASSLGAEELGEAFAEEVVLHALSQLRRFRLLEEPVAPLPAGMTTMSRRELARKLGLAAAASLPLVISIVAPTAASAATCGAVGTFCTENARCCSGLCMNNTCVCLDFSSPCTSDVQCCSGRCGSANNKCLP